LPPYSFQPIAIAFSSDGAYLATANAGSNDIALFNVAELAGGGISYPLPNGSTVPASIAFSPGSPYVAVANSGSNNIIVFSQIGGQLSNPLSYTLPSGSLYPVSLAFSPDSSYLTTANVATNDITLFRVTNGVLSGGVSYTLPESSSEPQSVIFLDLSNGLLIATANSGSNDVTVFDLQGNSVSYPLPNGAAYPLSLATQGTYLATANSATDSVTVFAVQGDVLSNAVSYYLPANSTNCVSIALSPVASNGNVYMVTANKGSNDISLFTLVGQSSPTSSSQLGLILGTVLGIPACIVGLTALGVAVSCFLYKYLYKKKTQPGMVHISAEQL
jgi:WD40 repeat protein